MEYIRNHSHRRFGKWWQIPIHLVEVAFPDKFYNINGLRLSLGEPVYPVTSRYLTFSWEPPNRSMFPNLIKEFDQGNLNQLLGFEAMLTAFACGLYSLDYPQDSQEGLVELFKQQHSMSEMQCFNKFCYYYYRKYCDKIICENEGTQELAIYDTMMAVLLLVSSRRQHDKHGERRHQELLGSSFEQDTHSKKLNHQELINLTNICRKKTSHWLNNPPQRADTAHP